MLVEALEKYSNTEERLPGDNELHQRMPQEIEEKLLESFDEYKRIFGVKREEKI